MRDARFSVVRETKTVSRSRKTKKKGKCHTTRTVCPYVKSAKWRRRVKKRSTATSFPSVNAPTRTARRRSGSPRDAAPLDRRRRRAHERRPRSRTRVRRPSRPSQVLVPLRRRGRAVASSAPRPPAHPLSPLRGNVAERPWRFRGITCSGCSRAPPAWAAGRSAADSSPWAPRRSRTSLGTSRCHVRARRAPRARDERKKRERATPTRARFGARRRSGSKHRESPERPLAGLPRVFSLPEAPKLVILTPPSLGVPSSRNTRRPAGRGSPGRGVRRAANRRPERRARNRRDKRAAPGGSAAAAAAHGRDGRARERAAETEKPAGAGAGGAGARRASRRRSIRG